MAETVKLYDIEPYVTEFTATVLVCNEVKWNKTSKYEVLLDKTLFFPEEGGQTCDRGYLDEIPVLDVQIRKDEIWHTVDNPLEKGSVVKGNVEWTHRFSNMQQHSGEHIFSGLMHSKYGYENVGFHLSDNIVTMDFNGVLSKEEAGEMESAVNEIIAKNVEITAEYPSKEVLESLSYRSKIEIEGPVRIVTIEGVDVCACCAPHVRRTGEIGIFKILNVQSHRGGVRISFLCGYRALEDYRAKSDLVGELINLFSKKEEDLYETIVALKENNQTLKYEIGAIKRKQMAEKVASLGEDETNVFFFEEDIDALVMRETVNQLVKACKGVCGVLVGNGDSYQFVIGSENVNCKEVLDTFRNHVQVRGGGSEIMVQGTMVGSKEEIQKAIAIL